MRQMLESLIFISHSKVKEGKPDALERYAGEVEPPILG